MPEISMKTLNLNHREISNGIKLVTGTLKLISEFD